MNDPKQFFVAEFSDVPYRDQRDTMERPFFSLSKNPRFTSIAYKVGEAEVTVEPSRDTPMATIWDADVLIWAATQVREAMDRGATTGPMLRFHARQLLSGIRRGASGRDYIELRAAMDRLAKTSVTTNLRIAGKKRHYGVFHWLDAWTEQKDATTGESLRMSLTLPLWFYEGIVDSQGVLTIHEDYFLLTGGLERWFYRVARKHAGRQALGWQFTMRQLHEKSGSVARFSDFALAMRRLIDRDKLPEYTSEIHQNGEGEEVVSIMPRLALAPDDPRRNPRRRLLRGIYSEPLELPPVD